MRVKSLGMRVEVLGSRDLGSEFKVSGLGFRA
jgi:hypothetical protein